ncbi:hypothetical protein COO59_02915 [Mixta theicola]|uniref:Uncharacterized protein n=1 Tax=Mixta theicola TaxID=1458355 RepID=A0A2K1QCY9_9GAMM|nr:hypothetical protein COO59_02915 [Mixta theicola]
MGTGRTYADLKHVENANHATRSLIINIAAEYALRIYPSYFRLHGCWLSAFTPVTYRCKLLRIHGAVACLQRELRRV